MNKKQTLVSELITKLVDIGINGSDDPDTFEQSLRAPDKFWERYPNGNCNPDYAPSIEGQLSCLSENSLQTIISSDTFKPGSQFDDLWRAWGRAGFFKKEPEILRSSREYPKLYARHDCYLHWFRDAGFQNSYDAYCNGSNGSSSMSFPTARRAITLPECSSLYTGDEDYDCSTDWNIKWALFRRAMYFSYAFQACAGKSVYHDVFRNKPELFTEFMNLTDTEAARVKTDPQLGPVEMREACADIGFDYPVELEIPLNNSRAKGGREVFAVLRYSKSAVRLTWSAGGKTQHLTIRFPDWDEEAWKAEAECMDLGCESPRCLPERDYIYTCWFDLSITLLNLAGIDCGSCWMAPWKGEQFDSAPCLFWDDERLASSTGDIERKCWEFTQRYLSRDDLVDIVCN